MDEVAKGTPPAGELAVAVRAPQVRDQRGPLQPRTAPYMLAQAVNAGLSIDGRDERFGGRSKVHPRQFGLPLAKPGYDRARPFRPGSANRLRSTGRTSAELLDQGEKSAGPLRIADAAIRDVLAVTAIILQRHRQQMHCLQTVGD